MKKYITICLALMTVFCVYSAERKPRVYSIIFADTQDESIGKAAIVSHDNYLNFFSRVESAIGSTDGPETFNFVKYECNNSNLVSTLRSLDCTPHDIVIFVYVGHGTRALKDESDFPQICFALPRGERYRNSNDFYPLEKIKNTIMQKNPRFCLVIGDCCNSYDPYLPPKGVNPDFTMADEVRPTIGWEAIKKLFMSKYGSVMLTASKKGEYGWCNSTFGMFLEHHFNQVFDDIASGKKEYNSWDELLEDVKNKTYQFSTTRQCIDKETGKRYYQTPYYKVELSDRRNIDPDFIDDNDKKYVTIKSALLKIADDQHSSDGERLANMRRVLDKYFDGNNALVDVVGIDNNTIIMSTTIREYLLRLATEKRLINLTILRQDKDKDDNIFYLKIHEIYREKTNK